MTPSISLETPIIESKPFLLRDSHLPKMIDDGLTYLRKVDEDDVLSTDSWDKISNEELNDIVEITKGIMSPPASPSAISPPASPSDISIKSELNSDDASDYKDALRLDSPSNLVHMIDAKAMVGDNKKTMNETPELRAMKRERNRLAARRCRQKQKDRIDYLERDVKQIETENYKVENEIRLLQQELKDLQNALLHHDCQMKHMNFLTVKL